MKKLLAVDIGSTWTKGARFKLEDDDTLVLEEIRRTPTTVKDLAEGFNTCRALLDAKQECELFYSSSAKGGLRIASLGLVPDLTLKMAKEAACSAGGKISKVCAYKLNEEDVEELSQSEPDIILFSGGTDGGNEAYLRHNMEMLKLISPEIPVVYAGNRALHGILRRTLGDRDLRIVDNLLPALESPNPEPAREAIRDIFLQKIVSGRGLNKIVDATGQTPLPTPYVMLEFFKTLRLSKDSCDFAVIDMGGATTDFYSACNEKSEAMVIRRGLPEPPVKRTVEGDVGMRVSAKAAFEETGKEIIQRRGEDFFRQMAEYIEKVAQQCDYLPDNETEKSFDAELAGACCTAALRRHAGRRRQVFTANGVVALQTGRNLKNVQLVIGTGGFLSRMTPEAMKRIFWETTFDPENEVLVPENFICRADTESLSIMLANVGRKYPEAAIKALKKHLNL